MLPTFASKNEFSLQAKHCQYSKENLPNGCKKYHNSCAQEQQFNFKALEISMFTSESLLFYLFFHWQVLHKFVWNESTVEEILSLLPYVFLLLCDSRYISFILNNYAEFSLKEHKHIAYCSTKSTVPKEVLYNLCSYRIQIK